jgi:hypothetical protein
MNEFSIPRVNFGLYLMKCCVFQTGSRVGCYYIVLLLARVISLGYCGYGLESNFGYNGNDAIIVTMF